MTYSFPNTNPASNPKPWGLYTEVNLTPSINNKKSSYIQRTAKKALDFYADFKNMLLVGLTVFNSKRICVLTNFLRPVPFLNLIVAPLLFFHPSREVCKKSKLAWQSIQVRDVSNVFYNAGQGIANAGFAVSNLSKSTEGVLSLAGLAGKEIVELIFGAILSPVLLAAGAIGGAIKSWKLGRNIKTYVQFHSLAKALQNNPEAIRDIYDKLYSPKREVVKIDASMSARNIRKMMDIAKKRFNLRKAALNERYASNEKRFHAVLIHFEDEAALNLVKEKMLLFEGADELRALIEAGNVWGALEKEIEMYNEILKIVDSESFSEDFKRIYFKNDFNYHDFIESLRAGKSELEENLASFKSRVEEEGAWIADQIRSEMHRAMLHNGVAVLVAVLILTSGILGLTAFGLPYFYAANITAAVVSNLTTWSLGVGLAGGTIDMINIILDKMIGQKGFRKIEGILRTLEKEPSCTEPQSS